MPRGWHRPATRGALGPTAGRHSEWGHEGSAAAPPALCIEGDRAWQSQGCTSSLSQEPCLSLQRGRQAGAVLQIPGRHVTPLTATGTKVMPREPARLQTPPAGGCCCRVWVPGSGHAHTDNTDPGSGARSGEAQQSRGSGWLRSWLSSPSHHRVLDLGAQAHPGSLAGGRHLHEAVTDVERPLL